MGRTCSIHGEVRKYIQHSALYENLEKQFDRLTCRWKDGIKIDLKEIG
jgi:hypothetical protein